MDELVEWLRAQLDEDERIARAVPADLGRSWSDPGPWVMAGSGGGGREAEVAKAADGLEMPLAEHITHHIAEHDPARVLREIDAKRRTLIRCEEAMLSASPMLVHFAKQTAWEMALPYADRPGYREEWRP
ncbi:DUF6221 family protein [Streptomyces sp. NPDC016640]|uniref:DUF6221 family protein n=1 Tax=Streptomyces sp. NPDC016640 TaxID=3364969 RepID=UPI0036FCAEE2